MGERLNVELTIVKADPDFSGGMNVSLMNPPSPFVPKNESKLGTVRRRRMTKVGIFSVCRGEHGGREEEWK